MKRIEPDRYEIRRAMLLAGLRQSHSFTSVSETIPEQWQQFKALGNINGQVGSTAFGAVCGSTVNRFEYLAGIEVESFSVLSADMGRMRVPEQYYAVFQHRDHISTIPKTWELIFNEWLPRSGTQPAETPCFELYDERFNPKTGLGIVEIYFPILH